MMETEKEKLKRAKKRVDQIKGFYVHLAVYIVVNLIIVGSFMIRNGFGGEPVDFWGAFSTPVFWGIGLAFHGLHVFGIHGIFGPQWEERQIRKYMEEDRREAEKFK